MSNKIVRLAIFRDNNESICPFGLNIPDGCLNAGGLIKNMTPIDKFEERYDLTEDVRASAKEMLIESNKRVFMFGEQEQSGKCMYLDKILKNRNVECDFGDTNAGIGSSELTPSAPISTYMNTGYYSLPNFTWSVGPEDFGAPGELWANRTST